MQNPVAIPAFKDNYLWLLPAESGCWVVDPGDAAPVLDWLTKHGKALAGILLTHHHADHVGGVATLAQHYRCPVWGPDECRVWRTQAVQGGDDLLLDGLGRVHVLDVAAHTAGHVAYHLPDQRWLFCGDALFSAGCGRLFEGTAADLHRALDRINALPPDTWLFPTHEYTQSNLRFAQAVEPGNVAVAEAIETVRLKRALGEPSLPTSLSRERRINPFLRVQEPEIRARVARWRGQHGLTEVDTLAALRLWKDQF